LSVSVPHDDSILGNRSLARFDFCIIGSGAAGGSAAQVLTAAGKNVLVLEAGHNPFPRLDAPGELDAPLHGNDELKYTLRDYIDQQALLEPRTFRESDGEEALPYEDVNRMPRVVGGAFQHSPCTVPRFNAIDFRLRSTVDELIGRTPGLSVPGFGADAESATFTDWPFDYDELEPFYTEAEWLHGTQGIEDDPFASRRSLPYPMPPGVAMYSNLVLAEAARSIRLAGEPLNPHAAPAMINTQFRDGRPPCVDCGYCNGFGCPIHAKGAPPVTTLRRALLSGRCQLRFNATAVRLLRGGRRVSGVAYVDGSGALQRAEADAYILAATAIESARLCFLSDLGGQGLGNSSGLVGRNLMFHLQTGVNGFLPQRVHGQRGRTNSHALSDLRGVEPGGERIRVFKTDAGPRIHLGGVLDFATSQGEPIRNDGLVYAFDLPGPLGARRGPALKRAMRDLALGQHLVGFLMQGEDAPQLANRVDLDPRLRDVFGSPAARITYQHHQFELAARRFYLPLLRAMVQAAGAKEFTANGVTASSFVTPLDVALVGPPVTRHLFGTLRMGVDPKDSVTNPDGRFHDLENLYAADGSVFPTSSGYNPTLTMMAVARRIAHRLAGTSPAGETASRSSGMARSS
jgi:choline dehydrogenase-like flavoprotein